MKNEADWAEILDAVSAPPPWSVLLKAAPRERLRRAVLQVFLWAVGGAGTFVFLEDSDWVDALYWSGASVVDTSWSK